MSKDVVRTSIIIKRKIWAEFKAQCTLENKTVAELIEELIEKYLQSKHAN
jgi:predicted DNA-binding ribbon-helix-helix protein